MPKYMLDYIRLCRECSLDLRTIGNMISIVIPTLQREAAGTAQRGERICWSLS